MFVSVDNKGKIINAGNKITRPALQVSDQID